MGTHMDAAGRLTMSYWPADTSREIEEMAVGEALRRAAAEVPDTTALVTGVPDPERRQRWTYLDLLEQSERAAQALLSRFAPGDRVAVWANNIPEWVLLEYATALAGITLVTVNPTLRANELVYVLGQSRSDGIFFVPEYRGNLMAETLARVREHLPALRETISFTDWHEFCREGSPTQPLPEVAPGAPAQIQYTSGTTGIPKGAILHHRGVVNNARLSYVDRLKLEPGNVQLSPMPLFHTAGCVISVLGALASRGTLVLPPFFEPALCLDLIEAEWTGTVVGVPTMLLRLLDHPRFASTDLSHVTRVLSGGTVVPPPLVRRIEAVFAATCSIVFAQTEASPVITQTSPSDATSDRVGTVGRPLACTEVKVADPHSGEPLTIGQVGEICTRGYHVMTGYFDQPQMTAATIDTEGWLHTGDLASMDARGYCRIEGRLKDMIIRGGENIYPQEIEHVLFARDDVADVAVVGVPDEVWGEQVVAFVKPAAGRTLDQKELFAYCRQHLAPHKTPRHWIFIDEFPLTASGKIQKYVLRDQFQAECRLGEMGT